MLDQSNLDHHIEPTWQHTNTSHVSRVIELIFKTNPQKKTGEANATWQFHAMPSFFFPFFCSLQDKTPLLSPWAETKETIALTYIRVPTTVPTIAPVTRRAALPNSNGCRPAAVVTLSGDNLVVEGAQVHPQGCPCVEVVARCNATTGPFVPANRPVLLESGCPNNRRRIHTCGLVDVVSRPVAGDLAFLGGTSGGVVGAEVFDNVVLDEWCLGPAVDGEVAVS